MASFFAMLLFFENSEQIGCDIVKGIIVTNNPMTHDKFKDICEVIFFEDYSYEDVLKKARDMVHSGHRLLSHPLSGSVKPGETIYKSIALSKGSGALCLDSLRIIEESLQTAEKFTKVKRARILTEKIKRDFQLIDVSLISNY